MGVKPKLRPLPLSIPADNRLAELALKAVYTPSETSVLLGRSRSWTEARCKDGTLPARRVGTRWLLTRADLLAGGWIV